MLKSPRRGADAQRSMFSETHEADSFRADMIRALAFSKTDRVLEPEGAPTGAGIAGVWNGRRGMVLVVLSQSDPPTARRYSFDAEIESEDALDRALGGAVEFAGELGFAMDDPTFGDLEDEIREARLEEWNRIWMLRGDAPAGEAPSESGEEANDDRAEVEAGSNGVDGTLEANGSSSAAEHGRAVLGRIALVRRGRRNVLARILGYY